MKLFNKIVLYITAVLAVLMVVFLILANIFTDPAVVDDLMLYAIISGVGALLSPLCILRSMTYDKTWENKRKKMMGQPESYVKPTYGDVKFEDVAPKTVKEVKIDAEKKTGVIEGAIKEVSDSTLLIDFDSGKDIWIPKSVIRSEYDTNSNSNQKFTIDEWILKKNHLL